MRWRPRLRTVLLTANLLILLFPMGGVLLLRLYESVIVRRTESQLMVQGVVVAEAFRASLLRELKKRGIASVRYGVRPRGAPDSPWHQLKTRRRFQPLVPRLDTSTDSIHPVPGAASRPALPADGAAAAAGRQLSEMLRRVQRSTLAGIRIVDFRGTVVASTRSQLGRSLVHQQEVRRALHGERVSLLRKRYQRKEPRRPYSLRRYSFMRVFVALPVVVGDRVVGAVLLSRTPPTVEGSLFRRRWTLLVAGLAVLLVALALSLLASWLVSRPIRELVVQAERVARGERGAVTELHRPGTREVRQLSAALVKMAHSLEDRAQYIRTFASNVSHEFKTPLTAIRGAVELLRDHLGEMSDEERDRFLGNLEADTARLDRLVRRLMELARADVIEPSAEVTDVGTILRRVVERFGGEGLAVRIGELDDTDVKVAPEILESILSNLVENARQHGGDGVGVTVSAQWIGDRVAIRVTDDGPGISEANRERVFERFFTTAREQGGSGVGLSLVKALVTAHSGEVRLSSRPGETTFRVELPGVSQG